MLPTRERWDPNGENQITVQMDMVSLTEVDPSGNAISSQVCSPHPQFCERRSFAHECGSQMFPEAGSYLIDQTKTIRDSVIVMEYTFEVRIIASIQVLLPIMGDLTGVGA